MANISNEPRDWGGGHRIQNHYMYCYLIYKFGILLFFLLKSSNKH